MWNILMQTSYTINFGHCHFFFQSWFVSSSCDTKVTSWVSHGSCSSVSWWVTVNLCLCWNKCLTISTLHSVELLCLELYHALCNAKYIFGGFKRHKFLRNGYGVLHLYLGGFGCLWYGSVKGNISLSHLNILKGGWGSLSSPSGENDVHLGLSGWRPCRFLVHWKEEKIYNLS